MGRTILILIFSIVAFSGYAKAEVIESWICQENSYGSWNNIQNSGMMNFSTANLSHRINLNRQSSDNDYAFTFKDKTYFRENSDQKYFQV